MDSGQPGLRARLGKLASAVIPDLDDRIYNRDRDRALPSSRAPKGGYPAPAFEERQAHVVVVPIEGPQFPDWRPGARNFYYEAWQSARERWGPENVSVLDVAPGEPADSWHRRLRDLLHDSRATHFLTHMEHDPGSPDSWTWDEAWNAIAPDWDGVFLGNMFDSAFWLVTMKARRLARMSPHYLAVDICTPMTGVLIRNRCEVGPVTMPVSSESLALVHEKIDGLTPHHDVSFIGALYPYRVALIEKLRAEGVDVVVNPHRPDETRDFDSSKANQPEWLDYMAGLASSKMTINFSRSSAGDFEQLKTRVIEATLAGTFLLTDDKTSTRRFFTPGVEFDTLADVEELPRVVTKWLEHPELLESGRLAAQERAQGIALFDFWDGITQGLATRGLPELPPR